MNQGSASASYRPKGYGMSPALQRARAPFRTRNAIVGALVAAFATSVYWYSIAAVKQDEFTDVDALVPPAEQRRDIKSIEDQIREKGELKAATASALGTTPRDSPVVSDDRAGILQPAVTSTPEVVIPPPTSAPTIAPSPVAAPRGYVSRVLDGILPSIVHPTEGTLVWGAPNVDRVGYWSDRTATQDGQRLV